MATTYKGPDFTNQYKNKLNDTYTTVQTSSASWGGGSSTFTDVAYLRYNAVSGTQSGELGTLLIAPSTWVVTQLETMYYLDPRDSSNVAQTMNIIIPEASADNLNKTITLRKPNLAGDLATINVTTSAGQVIGTSTTYTFSHPSDYVQLVSNEFEFGAGDYKWRQSYDKRQPAQTLIVGTNGYDGFSSIQAAIDSIKDANSSTKPYVVRVQPGTYVENITLKDGVDLVGNGGSPFQTKLQPISGSVISWASGSTYSHINRLHILGPTNVLSNPSPLIMSSNGTHLINDCAIDWYAVSPSATQIVCVSAIDNSEIQFSNCIGGFYQYGQNGLSGTHSIWLRTEDNANVYMRRCSIDMYTQNADISGADEVEFISENSSDSSQVAYMDNYFTMVVDNPAFAGDIYFYEQYQNSSGNHFISNSISLSSNANDGVAAIYKSIANNGVEIRSTSNAIEMYGFGVKYFGIVPANDTLVSHFDDTQAVSEISGTGVFKYVYSQDEGQLHISDTLIVENTITLPLLSGDNTIVISDSNGVLTDTTMSITQGASAGSIINFVEFSVDPNIAEKLQGDLWVTNSPTTSAKLLKFWDGTYTYSVEMSKE